VSGAADQVEHLVRRHAGARCRIEAGPVWLRVLPSACALPEHGWKLHVSSRAATFGELVDKLLPLLLDEGCAFKLARSAAVLSRLNDGPPRSTTGTVRLPAPGNLMNEDA
jgi:hypothetical protein